MSDVSINDDYTFIHYRELPRFGLGEKAVAAKAGIGADQEDLVRAANVLKNLKRQLCNYMKNELKSMIVKSAIEEKMTVCGCTVKTFDDVETSWEMDGSLENAKKVFNILYSCFDKQEQRWSKVLEEKFMKEKKIKYNVQDLDSKQFKKRGCIEEQAINTLAYLRKLINRKGVNSHGYKINITRPSSILSELGADWRRPKGVFFSWMRQHVDNSEQKEKKRKYDEEKVESRKQMNVLTKIHEQHVEEIEILRQKEAKTIVNSTYSKKINGNNKKESTANEKEKGGTTYKDSIYMMLVKKKRNRNKELLRSKGFKNVSSDEEIDSHKLDEESESSDDDDDDDSLQEVLDHKEENTFGSKKKLMLEVLFSSGEKLWSDIKNVKKDKPLLIEEYAKKKGLESNPYFQLKQRENKKKQEVVYKSTAERDMNVKKTKTVDIGLQCRNGEKCNFDLELQVQEYLSPIPHEWIFNEKCNKCNKVFDSSCSIKMAFVCKAMRRMECENIFCFECGSVSLGSGRRRKRN